MDKSSQAGVYLEEFKTLMANEAFKILWAQVGREIRRAEVATIMVGNDARLNSEQLAAQLRDRQGFLRGLIQVQRLPDELMEEFAKGRVPWEVTR